MLVPGSEDGTPQSIQDRVPSTVSGSCEIPTTIHASSGTVRKLVGVQSRPPTEFISSDEEPLVRSVVERQVCLRVDEQRPRAVFGQRMQDQPKWIPRDSRRPQMRSIQPPEFLDGVPAPGNAVMVSGPNPHVLDIRTDDTQLSARRGSRRLVLNSQNMPVAHVEDVLDSHTERLARVRHVLLQERIDFQQRQANGVTSETSLRAKESPVTRTLRQESQRFQFLMRRPQERWQPPHRRQSSESQCSPWMKSILVLCLNNERQS